MPTCSSTLRDMAACIELEVSMARKKSNRASLEENKRAYRRNQAVIARAMRDNEGLEPVITEQENFEIIGIIRRHKVGLDNLAQVMQGDRPTGESLFFEEKQKPVSPEEEAELLTPKKAKEDQESKPQESKKKQEQEDTNHEE